MEWQYYRTKKQMHTFLVFCIVAGICFLLNFIGLLGRDIEIESVVLVGISSVVCITIIGQLSLSLSERLVLSTGYFIRLVYLCMDIYTDVLYIGEYDTSAFWKNAIGRYRGLEMPRYTVYPYIIEFFMSIFGENRLMVQYVNIIIWLLTIFVLYRCFALLEIGGRIRLFGVICVAFLPWYIMLTSILMRESLIIFLNTLSLYYFLKWYQRQRFLDIFLAELLVLFSMILHSGAIGLGVAYAVSYAFYHKKYKKIHISVKTTIMVFLGITGIFVVFISPYRSAALSYLPKFRNIFEIQKRWFDESGGSNYLRGMPYTENIFVFMKNTLIRMIYFFVSPVPWEWRGMMDAIAFCGDAAFHAVVIAFGLYQWRKSRKDRILIGFLFLCIFMIGLVFAWGVSNAGTAMRHRCKLVGIETILFCFCVKTRRTNTKKLNYSLLNPRYLKQKNVQR